MVFGKFLVHSAASNRLLPPKAMSLLRFLLRISTKANRQTVLLTVASVFLALLTAYRHTLTRTKHGRRRRRLPPGPTNYPIVGILPFLGREDPGKSVLELSKKYGPVFYGRLGNFDAIFLNDYESVREAFAKSGDAFSDRPRVTAFEAWSGGRGESNHILLSEIFEFWIEILKGSYGHFKSHSSSHDRNSFPRIKLCYFLKYFLKW